jgi:hypothetical protein
MLGVTTQIKPMNVSLLPTLELFNELLKSKYRFFYTPIRKAGSGYQQHPVKLFMSGR